MIIKKSIILKTNTKHVSGLEGGQGERNREKKERQVSGKKRTKREGRRGKSRNVLVKNNNKEVLIHVDK